MIERVLVAGLDAAEEDVVAEARRRRDDGQEVVLAGTGLDARQVAHVARAEDVGRLVVLTDAPADQVATGLHEELASLDVDGVEVQVVVRDA